MSPLSLKYPEDYNRPDYLYWNPKVVTRLPSRERGWVAKMLTITGWQITFESTGMKDRFGEPVWAKIAFGYAKELNRYVPEEELHG